MGNCAPSTKKKSEEKKSDKEILSLKYANLLNNKYIEIDILGRGGFSIVLKGWNKMQNRFEAIKAINLETLFQNGLEMKHVETEISILRKLNHQHIITGINAILTLDVSSLILYTSLYILEWSEIYFIWKMSFYI